MWDGKDLKDYLNEHINKGGRHLAIALSNLNKYNKEYLKIHIPQISTQLKENIYLYYYNMNSIPKCLCGKDKKYRGFFLGYDELCCKKDCIFWKNKKQKAANTTFNKKYGCHPMQTMETKNNLKESMILKYGIDNITKYHIINGTFISNFGKTDVIDKIKDTYIKKYGCHPMQTIEVMEKQKKNSKLFYDYFLPSGKKVRLQGYEGTVLNELLKKYKEEDILINIKDINKKIGFINYEYEGVKRKYYPDFYVIPENKIYEVKSSWTYKVNKEQNELKRKACLDKGISFEFIIL